jgi:hypothetical protein
MEVIRLGVHSETPAHRLDHRIEKSQTVREWLDATLPFFFWALQPTNSLRQLH